VWNAALREGGRPWAARRRDSAGGWPLGWLGLILEDDEVDAEPAMAAVASYLA